MFSKKDVLFLSLFTLLGIAAVISIAVAAANLVNEKPKREQQFYDKCNAACHPNGVFSTSYNRCMCAVGITYKEVK